MAQANLALKKYFGKLQDPRIDRHKKHLLLDIIGISICAVICGCDTWQQIELFGRSRHDWLKRFLQLPNGIPSHDTFERVFTRLDPQAFQACFRDWMRPLHEALGVSQIAIDGKTLRSSASGVLKALHLVSAWATANSLSLGQVAVDDDSNEIPAIPKLLELLDVNGALVTIDAMGCQKEIAAQIVDQQGDYLLAVKDNQPRLLADIRACFDQALENDFVGFHHDDYISKERGHGREELRYCSILKDPDFGSKSDWAGLSVIGKYYTEVIRDGKQSSETRYFIGSRNAGAEFYGQALRNHWSIENGLHWHMDVTFAEDANRVNRDHGAENLALLRRLALSLLKQHPEKRSIACKRLHAALDPDFLTEVLRGGVNSEKVQCVGPAISPNRTLPILLTILGVFWSGCCGCGTLFGFAGLGAAADPAAKTADAAGAAAGAIAYTLIGGVVTLLGIGIIGLSIWWFISQKPNYAVLLSTAAGEQQAYFSADSGEVNVIVGALNKAIVDRG